MRSSFDSSHFLENSRDWYLNGAAQKYIREVSDRTSSRIPRVINKGEKERQTNAPVRAVAQDGDNPTSLAELLCQFLGRNDVEGRRGSDVEAVAVEQVVDHADRVGVGDVQGTVEEVNVLREVVGDSTLANTCEREVTEAGGGGEDILVSQKNKNDRSR